MDNDFSEKAEKNQGLMELLFEENEINTIKKKLKKLEIKNVVFCSFESRFATSGGLGAVIKKLIPSLAEIKTVERVFLMTPFYPHIIPESKLTPAGIEPFAVNFGGKSINAELLAFKPGQDKLVEYYIKAPGFFESRNPINDPYGYFPDDPERNNEAQRENALFFCKAVPLAMKALGIRGNILFHLKEWQTTLIALTAKEAMLNGTLESCACVQTMHNPFDSWLSPGLLAKITDNKKILDNRTFTTLGGFTAYQVGIQLLDAPVTTVSEHFAEELTTDPLQTGHFADHLQEILKKKGVIGVNNGLFIDFPPDYSEARDYSLEEIKGIKSTWRKSLLNVLENYHPRERFGQLTYQYKGITHLPDDIPILVMSGRLDPFQKGFDILLMAIEKFARDEIKVVLSPLPANDLDMEVFYKTAWKCRGNVVVYPIRMEEGYRELQMGSTFGIMPSIYEPFGAAIEYMVSGTVTIARNTGGLTNQIEDKVCGFLYRENPHTYSLDNIKAFAKANNAMQKRRNNPWVQSMADELYKTIKHAAALYRDFPNDYYRLINAGLKKARTFTWKRAADAYYNIYRKISEE